MVLMETQEEPGLENEENQNTESDMELDLLAESESDSDDSNAEDADEGHRTGTGNHASRQGRSQSPEMVDSSRSHDNDGVDYYSGGESTADVDDEDAEIEEEDDDDDGDVTQTVRRLVIGKGLFVCAIIVIIAERPPLSIQMCKASKSLNYLPWHFWTIL